ncbi:MAG: Photosystem I reaction center subunit III [Leptolyngbyaceae cyanobacterium bins.59]|nr:Photosystem I reaction center subunit III [Leptolyngbyaceae cyanobacterium bins.59]
MQKLFTLLLVLCLWMGFAPAASADVAGLVPCREVPAFQQRLEVSVQGQQARLGQYDSNSQSAALIKGRIARTEARFQSYQDFLCGPDGLPRLITDGRLSHIGDFTLPGLLFLYLAGWLGWAGRTYLAKVHETDQPEFKEVQIDLPLAIQCFIGALLWPLIAFKEILSGEIQAKDTEIPVSPR